MGTILLFLFFHGQSLHSTTKIFNCLSLNHLYLYENINLSNEIVSFECDFDRFEDTVKCIHKYGFKLIIGEIKSSQYVLTNRTSGFNNFRKVQPLAKRVNIVFTLNRLMMYIMIPVFSFLFILIVLFFEIIPLKVDSKSQNFQFFFLDSNNRRITPFSGQHYDEDYMSKLASMARAENQSILCLYKYYPVAKTVVRFIYMPISQYFGCVIYLDSYIPDINFYDQLNYDYGEFISDVTGERQPCKVFIAPRNNQTSVFKAVTPRGNLVLSSDRESSSIGFHLFTYGRFYMIFIGMITNLLKLEPSKNAFRDFVETVYLKLNLSALSFYCTECNKVEQVKSCYRGDIEKETINQLLDQIKPTNFGQTAFVRNMNGFRAACYKFLVGRTGYSIVLLINRKGFILRGPERLFVIISTFLTVFYHVNISSSEDSRTLKRLHKLLEATNCFELFETKEATIEEPEMKNREIFPSSFQSIFNKEMKQNNQNENDYSSKKIDVDETTRTMNFYRSGKWLGQTRKDFFDDVLGCIVSTHFVEDLSMFKNTEEQIKAVNSDIELASKHLGLHKLHSLISLSDSSLSKELGYSEPVLSLMRLVYPDDVHVLHHIHLDSITTFRLRNSNDEPVWYSAVCTESPGHHFLGFIFSVQELTQMKNMVGDNLDDTLLSAAEDLFAIWLVDLQTHEIISSISRNEYGNGSISDIESIVHESDKKIFHDSLFSIPTQIHIKKVLQMRLSEGNYSYYEVIFNQSAVNTALIVALNIGAQKKTMEELQEVQELVDLALFHSSVVQWVFHDEHYPEKIFTCGPVTFEPLQLNWTSIDHNISHEYQTAAKEAFRQCLDTREPFEMEIPILFDQVHWILLRGSHSTTPGEIFGVYFDLTEIKTAAESLELQKQRAIEASRAKSLFLANMTHEIRAPLNGMFSLLELLFGTKMNDEQKTLVSCVEQSFERLLELLNDTLDLAKIDQKKMQPSMVNFAPLEVIEPLFQKAYKSIKKAKVSLEFNCPPDLPLLCFGEPHFLMRIAGNLISNAVKFTESGKIHIDLFYQNEQLVLCVSDTGIGISPENQKAIFEPFTQLDSSITRPYGGSGVGLSLISKLLHLINGTITLVSEEGKGAKFSVRLPFEATCVAYIPPRLFSYRMDILVLSKHSLLSSIVDLANSLGYAIIINEKQATSIIAMLVIDDDAESIEIAKAYKKKWSQIEIVIISSNIELLKPDDFDLMNPPLVPSKIRSLLISCKMKKFSKSYKKANKSEILGMKVLVADDTATNQIVMARILDKLSCTYSIVDNGRQAIEELKKNYYDLVLMDQQMPELDGPSACRIIRALNAPYSSIPIIAMTASNLKEDEEICLSAGMNCFLSKPISASKLYSVVSKIIQITQ